MARKTAAATIFFAFNTVTTRRRQTARNVSTASARLDFGARLSQPQRPEIIENPTIGL
jgi:hypothetical protein